MEKLGVGITALALILTGWVSHAGIFPQNPVEEVRVEVFVDRIIEVPTEKENYYRTCERASSRTFLSSWNGTLKDGVKPKDIESFLEQCLSYFKKDITPK